MFSKYFKLLGITFISKGCRGADNMFFVISAVVISLSILSLRSKLNLRIIYFFIFIIPLLVNFVRNSLLKFVINLNINYKDKVFSFSNESCGSLFFNFL